MKDAARYLVIIEEHSKEGFVTSRLLVSRFVAVGDAVAYAMQRRDTCGKPWTWVVETANAVHSLYEFKPN